MCSFVRQNKSYHGHCQVTVMHLVWLSNCFIQCLETSHCTVSHLVVSLYCQNPSESQLKTCGMNILNLLITILICLI